MPSDGAPYAIFAYAALLPWTSFSTALTTATGGVVSNANLVSKVYFPREILPLSYVLSALVDLAIASVVMLGLLWYYHVALTWNALFVFPIILVMLMFATAGGMFLGALNVRIRDIGVAMPLLLQLWMYATPVVYPMSALQASLPPLLRIALPAQPDGRRGRQLPSRSAPGHGPGLDIVRNRHWRSPSSASHSPMCISSIKRRPWRTSSNHIGVCSRNERPRVRQRFQALPRAGRECRRARRARARCARCGRLTRNSGLSAT